MSSEIAVDPEVDIGQGESQLSQKVSKKLKVSDTCSNCSTSLNGKYCHQCGQPSRSIIKFFGEVTGEVLSDTFGYDSRLKHTVIPLLFKPGKITIDYINGKVFHYVLPARLYIILSVVCILLVKMITDPSKMVNNGSADAQQNKVVVTEPNEAASDSKKVTSEKITLVNRQEPPVIKEGDSLASLVDPDSKNKPDIRESGTFKLSSGFTDEEQGEAGYFNFSYDDTSDELEFGGEFFRDYPQAKKVVVDIKNKSKSWKEDPTPLVNQIFELFPYMMVIILPLFAIVLKVTYLFKKRYYIEHLIFCMHNHCFIYFALILEMGLNFIEDRLRLYDHWLAQTISEIASYASIALLLWIVAYIVIAVKRVYRQGWFLSLTKTLILSCIYLTFLNLGLIITVVVGAWQA